MMHEFKNEIALVTGAASGIGRELALALARKGARVAVTDINRERLDQVLVELKRMGCDTAAYCVDHRSYEKVAEFAKTFFREWGSVDILCAAVSTNIVDFLVRNPGTVIG